MTTELLKRNWKVAVAEVLLSLLGTVGVVIVVATIVASQTTKQEVAATFLGYFEGGQLSLPILALLGTVFLAIRRHGRISALSSTFVYVFLFGPAFVAALIVGLNPGFKPAVLSPTNLSLLWWAYLILHTVWLLSLLLEPVMPTAQEAGKEEDDRVNKIKGKAAGRG